jgi:hypothetical protein
MLARLYLIVGLVSVGFAALFVRTLLRMPWRGPNEIALAIVLGVLILAQSVPAAGLPGAFWLRYPEWHPDRWPRLWTAFVVGTVVMIVTGYLFGGGLAAAWLLVLFPLLLGARLAKLRRGWIALWSVGSVVAVGLSVMAIVIARGYG